MNNEHLTTPEPNYSRHHMSYSSFFRKTTTLVSKRACVSFQPLHCKSIHHKSAFPLITSDHTRNRVTITYATLTLIIKLFHTSPTLYYEPSRTMASDEDYASFLEKANQDPSGGKASTQSTKTAGTKAVDTEVPKVLQEVEEYYVSDADEPFEPVSLKWKGDELPSANKFSELIGKEAESISQKRFDPRGQYTKVVDVVKKAGGNDVGFFNVELGGTRSEYFVVSTDGKGKIVGLKVMAVMS